MLLEVPVLVPGSDDLAMVREPVEQGHRHLPVAEDQENARRKVLGRGEPRPIRSNVHMDPKPNLPAGEARILLRQQAVRYGIPRREGGALDGGPGGERPRRVCAQKKPSTTSGGRLGISEPSR